MMESWRITAWEVFATIIFLIFEFYFGWSASHLFTWIIATITVAGSFLLIIPLPSGLVIGIIIFLIGLLGVYFLPPMPLPETETHGWLVPADDPSPRNPCIQDRLALAPAPTPGSIYFYYGGNVMEVAPDVTHFTFLTLDHVPVLWADKDSRGRFTISGDFFAETGELIGRIRNGEFNIVRSQYSYSQRADASTLELYDIFGKEMLYVRFLNPSAIRIRGRFFGPKGRPVDITDGKIKTTGLNLQFGGCTTFRGGGTFLGF